MFERYTEKARRVVFSARYEATQYGSSTLEAEHLLLGIMREDRAVANYLVRAGASVEEIRRKIEAGISAKGRKKISTSVDLPLSQECHRTLKGATEEADRLGHQHIGSEHLFLAILAETHSRAAAILRDFGLRAAELRPRLADGALSPSGRTLQLAIEEFVETWIQRDFEMFLDFFQVDALLVDQGGNLHEGRPAIAEYCAQVWAAAKNLNTLKVTPAESRMLRQGVAVVPIVWEFAAAAAGQTPRMVRALLLMCEHDSEWEIAAAQLTEARQPVPDGSEPKM
jgi:uncharacterized protein (TIGR02246 family)